MTLIAPAPASALTRANPRLGGLPAGMTLAQAPPGLRAAARRTLGGPDVPAGSVFQQAELTASDAVAGDDVGDSVAIAGSTAVVGAASKNSSTGAAYVFVRSGT